MKAESRLLFELNTSDNNKKEEKKTEENYFKINSKNDFDIYNSEESYKKLKEVIKYTDELIKEKSDKNDFLGIFINKLFPKCRGKKFLICKEISKKFINLKKIENNIIEEKINNMNRKRYEIRYSISFCLDKEIIKDIGYILIYTYSKFEGLKIFDNNNLIKRIKKLRESQRDVISDYYSYITTNGISPEYFNIGNFLLNANKYALPGVFIYLINLLKFIHLLEINIDIKIDNIKEDYNDFFYLFIITYINIHYIFTSTSYVKINFNTIQLQKDIYSYFTEELENIYKSNNKYFTMNEQIPENEIHKIKNWNFEKDYLIKKRKTYKIIQESNINNCNVSNDIKQNNFVSISSEGKMKYYLGKKNNDHIEKINKKNVFDKNNTKKIKSKYDEIIEKNKNILEIYIFLLLVNELRMIKSIDLFINDCYYKEIINYFKNYFSLDLELPICLKSFHPLNMNILQNNYVRHCNIEFNCLDYLTFYKLFSLLEKNNTINSLQISFFPSLISYTPQFIFKLYQQYSEKQQINFIDNKFELFILQEFLPFFLENLELLFELIKKKNDKLETIGFIFNIPDIISINERYLNGIVKFILNILFLVNNEYSKTKKLVIISPKTILDSHSILFIDKHKIPEKCKKLQELSIQMQFYQINNIIHLINSNLINLKIGEVDIAVLSELTKYLCSFNFFKNSSLEMLTIGILNNITHFTKEMEYLLNELFAIKIKTLKSINIYSNILIMEKNRYFRIFENNWISSCSLILNEKSKLLWEEKKIDEKINKINEKNQKTNIKTEDKHKKIYFLIHHELENSLCTKKQLDKRKKNEYINNNCEVGWYLSYILFCKYAKKNKYEISYYNQKKIIFNILKYLFFTGEVKINSEIKDDIENEDTFSSYSNGNYISDKLDCLNKYINL